MTDAPSEIRNAVRRLVTRAGGRMISRPVLRDRPDRDWTIAEPEPLAAIRAAADLEFEAGQAITRAARYAREDGLTWEQIGEALYPADPEPGGDSRAMRAFARLGSAYDSFEAATFTWTCPACHGRVRDYGPETGCHPTEDERGHACDCERLAQAVADYDAQWEEDG